MRLPPWHAHPDVWLLIAAVEGGYLWAIRRGGGPVTRRQVVTFTTGVAIMWIEHIVHILVQVIDRLVCMDAGRVIAQGPPAAVLESAAVIDAYLGRGAR